MYKFCSRPPLSLLLPRAGHAALSWRFSSWCVRDSTASRVKRSRAYGHTKEIKHFWWGFFPWHFWRDFFFFLTAKDIKVDICRTGGIIRCACVCVIAIVFRCDSMSVNVSNGAIMTSGISGNLLHRQQHLIIAKPTQHHYLLLVRLPAPALIQQRCTLRQGKTKNAPNFENSIFFFLRRKCWANQPGKKKWFTNVTSKCFFS